MKTYIIWFLCCAAGWIFGVLSKFASDWLTDIRRTKQEKKKEIEWITTAHQVLLDALASYDSIYVMTAGCVGDTIEFVEKDTGKYVQQQFKDVSNQLRLLKQIEKRGLATYEFNGNSHIFRLS